MYPIVRLRRNRRTSWLRDLNAETTLLPNNLILPLFVVEGENIKQEIKTLPGVYRYSMDNIVKMAKQAQSLGIRAIALFPCVAPELKSENADEAYNLDNLICRTVRKIKDANIEIGIICDVALDPYTTHGHDGILLDGDVDNDQTVEALLNQSLVLAKAGVDILAPSDMMDGRIMGIREGIDEQGFHQVNILAYAAKYNSSFYGPFRDAVGSNKNNYVCKATYQMDVRNKKEALREIEQDIEEGADMVMVKPAMSSLDIISEASGIFHTHILAFQVSGEYAMLKYAAMNNALDWKKSMTESLTCIKRAGASAIFTYAAMEIANGF